MTKAIYKIIKSGSIIIVLLSIIILCCHYYLSNHDHLEYEIWFDTKDYFGNGEYQIYNNPSDSYALINMKYNVAVIDNVANYMKKTTRYFLRVICIIVPILELKQIYFLC